MNRRTLLILSTLLGGLSPLRLLAQEPSRRASRSKPDPDDAPRSSGSRSRQDDPPKGDDEPADDLPPTMPVEAGQQWKTFDISGYTGLPHQEKNPQDRIVDWIIRRTTSAPWYGEKIAVLSAGRSKLRVYQNAKILDQVKEVVERFVEAHADMLNLHVRFIAAPDTRWRYSVYKQLNLIGSGPQGQQIWSVKPDVIETILNYLKMTQGLRSIADQKFKLINGQFAKMESVVSRPYTGSIQRDSAIAQGFQPKTDELTEGINLRIDPLLSYDGDTLDAAILLTTNEVRTYHPTRVITPREVGQGELRVDVPEASATHLNQTIRRWPIGQTLLISTGVQPGILESKGGFLNMKIPGTVPTTTELLVFLDVEIAEDRTARKADRGGSRR